VTPGDERPRTGAAGRNDPRTRVSDSRTAGRSILVGDEPTASTVITLPPLMATLAA